MASTVALHFLSVLLLLLMNGHSTRARDIKVELPNKEQVEWYKVTPLSHDESYGEGYISISESSEPYYKASYTTTKHNHHHEKLNHPCKTSDDHKSDEPSYIAGYRIKTHESNAPYIAGYKTTSATHKIGPPYTPYIASYNTISDKKISKESSHDNTAKPYITVYGDVSPTNKPKVSSQDDTIKPYITAYGDASPNNKPKVSYQDYTIKPYITAYGDVSPNNKPKMSSQDDTIKPYITVYGDVSPNNKPKVSSQDYTIKPYITVYGDANPNNKPKVLSQDDITKPYITIYGDARPNNELKDSSNVDHTEAFKTGFFALDDLYVENVMTLQFPIQEVSDFLPRKDVEPIPFSISQLSIVLQLFSLSGDSPKANAMRDTLEQCESKPITGETKICATSLESMLEFVNTIIGSEVKHNILTTSYPTTSSIPLQKYTILEISQDVNTPKWVACHPLPYPYAVYYCHFIATGSKVFKVLLGGENDNKVEALGICHLDTSDWDPNHVIFRQLGITPGKDPVCHFFPVNHLMWVPQPSQATM